MLMLSLNPKHVIGWIVAILAALLMAHGMALLMTYGFGHDYVFGLVPLFNIALEQNLPTLFSTMLLLANGCMFFVLYRVDDSSRYTRNVWMLLAAAFWFLGVDESALIHERLSAPVKELFPVGRYLFFAWIIPYGIAAALLAVAVLYPIWQLGWRYRLLFGAAGLVYLSGAIGMEILGGNYYQANQQQVDLTYRLFQTVEETFELVGLTILVYTLLDLIRNRIDSLVLRWS